MSNTIAMPAVLAIEGVLAAWSEAWNAHDAAALSRLFTEDADFVNVIGMHFHGRADIEAAHQELHNGRFRETRIKQHQPTIHFLSADVALAHVRWEMTGDTIMPGIDRNGVRRGVFTHVLVRQGGTWRLRASHNTHVTLPPGFATDPFWRRFI